MTKEELIAKMAHPLVSPKLRQALHYRPYRSGDHVPEERQRVSLVNFDLYGCQSV
jgi:hypothetical protein